MFKFRQKLQAALFIFTWGISFTTWGVSNSEIKTQIEAVIQSTLPEASLGILLVDAKEGVVLYERHATELFPPASITKLFTAAASLLALGPDYRYETAILVNEDQFQAGATTVSGNLYLRFEGDPSLTFADLKKCITELKNQHIKKIAGNIVIDTSRFEAPDYGAGWSWDNLAWYYATPVTAIIIDQNQIPLTFNSSAALGNKVAVTMAANTETKIQVNSDIKIVSEEEAQNRCQLLVSMDPQNNLSLGGCWPQQAAALTLKFALKDPFILLKQTLIDLLQAEKFEFSAKIIQGEAPTGLKTLVSHYSKPVKELLIPVLHDSNNLYAESLVKTLGYKRYSRGTFQLGIAAMKEVLSENSSFDFKSLLLVDGSGLSSNNFATPQQFAQLLLSMHSHEKLSQDFKKALPVAGSVVGTLQHRLKLPEFKDRIQAKTGSLLGVSSLSGYLTSQQGKELIFVIMIDHELDKEKMRIFENELCKIFMTADYLENTVLHKGQ